MSSIFQVNVNIAELIFFVPIHWVNLFKFQPKVKSNVHFLSAN